MTETLDPGPECRARSQTWGWVRGMRGGPHPPRLPVQPVAPAPHARPRPPCLWASVRAAPSPLVPGTARAFCPFSSGISCPRLPLPSVRCPSFLHTLVFSPHCPLTYSASSRQQSPRGRVPGLPAIPASGPGPPGQRRCSVQGFCAHPDPWPFPPTGHSAVLRGEATHGCQHRGPPGLWQVPGR